MCGIFFSVGLVVDRSRIDIIEHRGPDGDGWKEWDTQLGKLALGHKRLAIIDTSEAAAQPFVYAGNRYHLVFNGEIYNYVELKEQLAGRGHVFTTHSDTEVLVAAYAEWGSACLDRLLGMFAFVIWDVQAQTIFVARDRFGIKPLYYVNSPAGLAIGSEIKQLLDLPGGERRLNAARAIDFLSEGLLNHSSDTMFVGIQQVRRGEAFELDFGQWSPGEPLPIRRWYRLPEVGSLVLSEAEAADRFYELMEDSIRLHLRSDVPIGSCLSGGLDSSAIVCLMRQELESNGAGDNLNTISACFDEASVDERKYISVVNDHTRASSHYVFPSPEQAFGDAEKITWHQDEPYGSTSIYAQWSVFQEAKRLGIKVMLDGQGADEQMAGYHGAFGQYSAELWSRRQYLELMKLFRERQKLHGISIKQQMMTTLLPLLPPVIRGAALRLRQQVVQHNWLDAPVFHGLNRKVSGFSQALQENGLSDVNSIGNLSAALTDSLNLQMLLHWEDRNSMAHSIESRVPFLDHRLVELNIGLGSAHKIKGAETKRILRVAMRNTLPGEILNRHDKLGFATPEEVWFKTVMRNDVLRGVEDTLSMFPDLLNREGTLALTKDMLDGRMPFNFVPWRIVSLGIWARLFKVSM
ncbi:MAG: asparagine synthase (glutamine-hydrolyzing) [Rhodobiaceae bacterium]|nr:asparagine synthase (glutamine-hydrolyzing) [Rhodobiaceae bacterium]